ncbi:uncharacterized protein LOC120681999 [Panicum virgatum]|nr:uncharacterized protein LOC120681999 [Panicum virgatum]
MTQTPARSELVWPQPVDPTKAPFVLKDGEEGARWGSLRMQGQSVQHRLTSAAAELNKALGELSGIPDMIQDLEALSNRKSQFLRVEHARQWGEESASLRLGELKRELVATGAAERHAGERASAAERELNGA